MQLVKLSKKQNEGAEEESPQPPHVENVCPGEVGLNVTYKFLLKYTKYREVIVK